MHAEVAVDDRKRVVGITHLARARSMVSESIPLDELPDVFVAVDMSAGVGLFDRMASEIMS